MCCKIKLSAPLYLSLLSRKQHRSVADVTALIEISPFPSRVAIFAFLSNSSCLSALSCCHSEGFLRGCSRMLPARTGLSEMGSSTHGWSSALGTSCQDQALLFLISTFAAESGFIPVCFFFQKWLAVCSAVYPASRACSHTKARCCQHKATQRAILSFPLGLSKEASAHHVPTARLETSHHRAAVGLGSCCCGTRGELVSSPTGHRLSHSSWCFLL